jgi:hypothetical protein
MASQEKTDCSSQAQPFGRLTLVGPAMPICERWILNWLGRHIVGDFDVGLILEFCDNARFDCE